MPETKPEQDDFSKPPPECDILCPYRPCYHPGYDKGVYWQGRGFKTCYKNPAYVCMTRLTSGCGDMRTAKTVDMDRLVKDLMEKRQSLKATLKVKRLVYDMICIISELGKGGEDEFKRGSRRHKDDTKRPNNQWLQSNRREHLLQGVPV